MERIENFLNKLSESFLSEKKYWILTIIILSVPATWALLVPGFFGASDELHIAWLHQMDKVIRIGQIPPRFVPDLSFGFGYPLFNFVFPLPFYIAELFHLMGLSLVNSIKLLFILSIPLSSIFMFLLIRELTKDNLLSLVGAMLYVYTPYRAVDIYIRGAIGEALSFVFLPLIVLSLIKLKESQGLRWIGIGSIALASLVLSHNITAYMFFSYIALFFVLQIFSIKKKKDYLLKSILMGFLGLLISIYFWLPALKESSLLKYDTVFNFVDHFPTLRQLITPYWGYGASVPGPGDGISFFLGYANLLILISGITLLIFNWRKITLDKRILVIWSVMGVISAVFLMNYRSIFLWSNLPLLPYFQFPWRFLILTTFFIPLLLILLKDLKSYFYIILLCLIILPTAYFFRPQDFLGRTDSYFLNRYIPIPTASEEYLKIQEEYLRLPLETEKRPDKVYPILYPEDKVRNIKIINDLYITADIESNEQFTLNVSKYNFPGWKAKVNGEDIKLAAGSPFGQISIPISPGSHNIEVFFTEPIYKKILDFASLVGFLVSLGLIFKGLKIR